MKLNNMHKNSITMKTSDTPPFTQGNLGTRQNFGEIALGNANGPAPPDNSTSQDSARGKVSFLQIRNAGESKTWNHMVPLAECMHKLQTGPLLHHN